MSAVAEKRAFRQCSEASSSPDTIPASKALKAPASIALLRTLKIQDRKSKERMLQNRQELIAMKCNSLG